MSPVRATVLQLSLDLQLRTLQLSRYARSKRISSKYIEPRLPLVQVSRAARAGGGRDGGTDFEQPWVWVWVWVCVRWFPSQRENDSLARQLLAKLSMA